MAEPRFQRRKEDRPREITEAALDVFAEKGYAGARVNDVAKRAGVSKGLLYLYFKTKEDLFKAVVRSFVSPQVEALQAAVETTGLSTEEFLRGPFLDIAKRLPKSPARVLVRLMISEGPKHPDLVAWYWENVISKAIAALRQLIRAGVQSGELRESAVEEFPQLLVSPVLMSVLWQIVFQKHHALDTDAFIEAHVDLLLEALKVESP